MSFRSITVQRDELPWTWTLRLGGTVSSLRSRAVITAVDKDGVPHQAELAPCPGVHSEDMDEALRYWQSMQGLLQSTFTLEHWNWIRPAFGLLDLPGTIPRSVLAAVEQLLLSWAQQQYPERFSLPTALPLEGSALLALQIQGEASWDEFVQLWEEGFRVFKIKVGRLPERYEYELLQKFSEYGQGALRLRLDANRGMNPEGLLFWQAHAHELPIAYWEEAAGMEPLALDETLWDATREAPQAQAWILKPSRLGLSRSVELMQKAALANVPCVLSNAFDSGLSLRCFAWLYAAFCDKPQPLGFGTTRFLPPDPWQSARWGAALVKIPRHPFSGKNEA
jgi:O-succinylbenzoate synthase